MKVLLALAAASINFTIPIQYQAGYTILVHMTDNQQELDRLCGTAPEGMVKLGCAYPGKSEIVTGNPCDYLEVKDINSYAHLACHEKAHVNGWRHQ